MELIEKLSHIQQEMKAPKNMYNSFGEYSYRNVEGILEAFKPFEGKYGVALTLEDDIILVADRVYVRATATLRDIESIKTILVSASAREPESKKKMDESQITGSTSSYARKYALNGLFLLDDTKDADTDEYHKATHENAPQSPTDIARSVTPISAEQENIIKAELNRTGVSLETILKIYKIKSLSEMTADQYVNCMKRLKATKTKEVATA